MPRVGWAKRSVPTIQTFKEQQPMRIILHPGFILHHRPYRETSMILDLFTQDYGRISVVAKGVRKERSKWRAILQPFSPLLISWQGKSELMNLVTVETHTTPLYLKGDCLLGAFYLNELLMRVLHKHDPHPQLFVIYHQTLKDLQQETLQQKTLRLFEKKLLQEIGYGLQWSMSFSAEKFYSFHPEQGFEIEAEKTANVFSGKSLIAIAADKLDEVEVLRDAKKLMRTALAPLLGSQPLQSRKLFL